MNIGTDAEERKGIERHKATERRKAILKIQSEIMRSARRFLESEGFLEVLSPVFEPFTDTGIGDAEFFEIDYYGKRYKLMSALTIHKPILVKQLGDIFSFTPCSRKEPVECRMVKRHLAQFYQIEVEMEGDCDKVMEKLEKMIKYIIDEVRVSCEKELRLLGRELSSLKLPFRKITYREAVEVAKRLGMSVDQKSGISWEVEKKLSAHFGEPFFITRFPAALIADRGFLYKVDSETKADSETGKTLLDFDLIMPEGHGEVCSGSEREFEYEKIVEKLEKQGKEQINSFKSYLEIIKSGLKPTSGFGIGVERLTKYVCGLEDISDASPFPKIPGVS